MGFENRKEKSLLSGRLQLIASMVTAGGTVADIGTDHGFLPVELVKTGRCTGGIASDIGKGPIERARAHVKEAGPEISGKIDVRLGPGLRTLKAGEADSVVIAGMGGLLVRDILAEEPEIAASAKELILSPHTELPELRRYLSENGYRIADEKMIFDEGKFYTVLRAVPGGKDSGKSTKEALSEREREFGPVLLRERPGVFADYLSDRLEKTERIVKKLRAEKDSEPVRKALREKEREAREIRDILGNTNG